MRTRGASVAMIATGLVLVAARLVTAREIGDQYLVFAVVPGILALSTLLLISVWRRYFSHLPAWTLGLAILVTGLIYPTLAAEQPRDV